MKILAVALVLLGIIALFYGGMGFNRQTTIMDVGGIKATATEHKGIPLAPFAGAIALLGGIALLWFQRPTAAQALRVDR